QIWVFRGVYDPSPVESPSSGCGGPPKVVDEESGFLKANRVSAAKMFYLSRKIHTNKVILCDSPHPPLRGPPSPLGKAKERTAKQQFEASSKS
ncbi:MAG: hypothetical protein IKU90_03305, partial [Clostridia bacterium]|nr:hypothetical protein [Clostridia bacterium]